MLSFFTHFELIFVVLNLHFHDEVLILQVIQLLAVCIKKVISDNLLQVFYRHRRRNKSDASESQIFHFKNNIISRH